MYLRGLYTPASMFMLRIVPMAQWYAVTWMRPAITLGSMLPNKVKLLKLRFSEDWHRVGPSFLPLVSGVRPTALATLFVHNKTFPQAGIGNLQSSIWWCPKYIFIGWFWRYVPLQLGLSTLMYNKGHAFFTRVQCSFLGSPEIYPSLRDFLLHPS